MNVNDVFPPRNLPVPAMQWGREMEIRLRSLQKEANAAADDIKNHNRTTAAVTEELSRQLKKLEGFLEELQGLLDELQDLLAELQVLYRAVPKTRQLSATSSGFSAGENWTTICSATVSFPEGSNHVEISAFGNAGLAWAGGDRVATLNGRMVIRGGSGPYVSADEFSVAGQYMAVLTPQNTRSLDGTQDFQVELQARATDPLAYPADTDNYASLTVLATFTGVGDTPEPSPGLFSPSLPILESRVRVARETNSPAAVVIAGSSTSAANPGYIGAYTSALQTAYPVEFPSSAQWDIDAEFTERSDPGIHVYSAGHGGTMSSTYLPDAECDRIIDLNPVMVLHMIGANDYFNSVSPAAYESAVQDRINYINSRMPSPPQHLLVHTYPRWGNAQPGKYARPWSEYLDALERIASRDATAVLFNLVPDYAEVGVSESDHSDPLGLIGPDEVHQTEAGYAFMANLLSDRTLAR